MRVIELEEILTGLDESAALEAVAGGFQRHARGEAVVPPPMHLAFSDPQGDCHVKAAAVARPVPATFPCRRSYLERKYRNITGEAR